MSEVKSQATRLVRNWKNKKDRVGVQACVGRKMPDMTGLTGLIGSDGRYGNKICIGPDGDRSEVLRKYETFLLSDTKEARLLRQDMRTNLKGKVLACWCSPLPCHADIIARVANGPEEEEMKNNMEVDVGEAKRAKPKSDELPDHLKE